MERGRRQKHAQLVRRTWLKFTEERREGRMKVRDGWSQEKILLSFMGYSKNSDFYSSEMRTHQVLVKELIWVLIVFHRLLKQTPKDKSKESSWQAVDIIYLANSLNFSVDDWVLINFTVWSSLRGATLGCKNTSSAARYILCLYFCEMDMITIAIT